MAGDYIFKLTVVPRQGQETPEITKNTATIKIKPQPAKPIEIISFQINNEESGQKAKHVFAINKEREPVDIIISWEVKEDEDIKVELLPSPGVVPLQGSITYSLGQPPSSEAIALKVTNNKSGEQKTQSVVVETVESSGLNQPQTSESTGSNPSQTSESGAVSPSPLNPDKLSPIELPPSPH